MGLQQRDTFRIVLDKMLEACVKIIIEGCLRAGLIVGAKILSPGGIGEGFIDQ
jgi:hypothetical protein